MGIISWIIFGLIAGIIAKWIMPGNDPMGCVLTILLGIGGAVVGGFIGTQLELGEVDSFDIRSFGLAIIGALVLLFIFRQLKGR